MSEQIMNLNGTSMTDSEFNTTSTLMGASTGLAAGVIAGTSFAALPGAAILGVVCMALGALCGAIFGDKAARRASRHHG